jgi:hypothetical protein
VKNLRFTKVFTDHEAAALRGPYGSMHGDAFESILRTIKDSGKRITREQQARIIQIGGLMGSPKHMFDWLTAFVREEEHRPADKPGRRWWRFWQ